MTTGRAAKEKSQTHNRITSGRYTNDVMSNDTATISIGGGRVDTDASTNDRLLSSGYFNQTMKNYKPYAAQLKEKTY